MRIKKIVLVLFLLPLLCAGQDREWTVEEQEILAVLEKQRQAGRSFDVEG